MKWLRGMGFVFLLSDRIEAMGLPVNLKNTHKEGYQFMVRCIKQAKDPSNDKFDPILVIGFKLLPEKSEDIVIYWEGEFSKKIKKTLSKSQTNNSIFIKGEYTKFPEYMTLDERERWRREDRLLLMDKTREPSKFYLRWEKYINRI
jgi:hypothetical protein